MTTAVQVQAVIDALNATSGRSFASKMTIVESTLRDNEPLPQRIARTLEQHEARVRILRAHPEL